VAEFTGGGRFSNVLRWAKGGAMVGLKSSTRVRNAQIAIVKKQRQDRLIERGNFSEALGEQRSGHEESIIPVSYGPEGSNIGWIWEWPPRGSR